MYVHRSERPMYAVPGAKLGVITPLSCVALFRPVAPPSLQLATLHYTSTSRCPDIRDEGVTYVLVLYVLLSFPRARYAPTQDVLLRIRTTYPRLTFARFQYFGIDGQQIGYGCPQGISCGYAHPDDIQWAFASQGRYNENPYFNAALPGGGSTSSGRPSELPPPPPTKTLVNLPPKERVANASVAPTSPADRDPAPSPRHRDDDDMTSRAPPPRYPRPRSPAATSSITSSPEVRSRKPSLAERLSIDKDQAPRYRDDDRRREPDSDRRRYETDWERERDREREREREKDRERYMERSRDERSAPRRSSRSSSRSRRRGSHGASSPPPIRRELSEGEKQDIWLDRIK